jgi:prepilin-type N-terminal cleavage/methylation domain-containing protein
MSVKSGLTLIELTVVLAVVSVVTIGAVMSSGAAERRLLYNTSLKLQADLRYAQRMAIIEGHDYGVIFTAGSYMVFTVDEINSDLIKSDVGLPDGVSFMHAPPARVHYLPRGTISDGFTVTLRTKRYKQELTGVPSGGRIKITDVSTY